MDLDAGAKPPVGVDTPSQLTVYVGDPPRQLTIFTGVATPEFVSNGDLDHDTLNIRLGATTTQNFGWTAQAALASISNENTDFVFATDAASVDVDPVDQVLRVNIAIGTQGDQSVLHRVSYTVHVLSDPIQAKISGQISWIQSFGGPTFTVTKGGNPMFRIDIGQTVNVPVPVGSFPKLQFVTHSSGYSSLPVASGNAWVAAYEIDDVPLGTLWEVRPVLIGGTLDGPPYPYEASPGFEPNPQTVQLALDHPSASGVDFKMMFLSGPK
jgi:hypothetical protein